MIYLEVSENLGRKASGAIFRVIYLSLDIYAAAQQSAKIQDGEAKSYRIYELAVSDRGDS